MTVDDRRLALLADRWHQLDAAGFLQSLADEPNAQAPHFAHLGLRILTAEPGRVELAWMPQGHLCNPAGLVHGGYLSVVLDDAAGMASASVADQFVPMLTMDLRIDFVRPARPGIRYTAIGTVVHVGGTRRISDARILDADQRLIARASGTFTPNRTYLEALGRS